jgi:hypothetical protein
MMYLEAKSRVRKGYVSLSIAVLSLFCFSGMANSQVNVKKEAMVLVEAVQIKSPSAIKVAFIDSNFSGVEVADFLGSLETYDVATDSTEGVTENIVTQQGSVLAENNNHGTKVLREFMAEYESLKGGYAPNILLVKISTGKDAEGKVSSTRVAAGIRYATNHGAKVINISLGTLQQTKNTLEAIKYARSHGVIVVAASGNWGEDKDVPKKTMSVYAQAPGVVAVGAMDDNGIIASYTSGVGNGKLQFVARTRFGTGTSLASPVVAADVVGILEENINSSTDDNANGKWDIMEIENALIDGMQNKYFSVKAVEMAS